MTYFYKFLHRIFCALFFIMITSLTYSQTLSIIHKQQQNNGPSSFGNLNAKLEEFAVRDLALTKEASQALKGSEMAVARTAVFDYCYPHNEEEYKAIGGAGLILITAISHSKQELPLARAYLKVDNYLIELVKIKSVMSKQTSSNSIVAKVYGEFRSDELYILPIPLLEFKPVLKVDFAKNRTGLELITFELPNLGFTPTVIEKKINPEKIHEFAKREYPEVF